MVQAGVGACGSVVRAQAQVVPAELLGLVAALAALPPARTAFGAAVPAGELAVPSRGVEILVLRAFAIIDSAVWARTSGVDVGRDAIANVGCRVPL